MIAIDDGHLLKMIAQHLRGHESGHPTADDDGLPGGNTLVVKLEIAGTRQKRSRGIMTHDDFPFAVTTLRSTL
jgi:hypothetical protein